MSIALDYTSRIDPAALKAAGVTDVCRYLSWLYRWAGQTHTYINPKIIQEREYDELIAAGLGVTLNWEYDARDWLSGADGGKAHAAEAVRQARALGYPAGCTIIGSADWNMSRAEWDSAGKAYALAWNAGIVAGGYRAGVYGPYDVLTWCKAETPIRVFWQAGMSTSWSAGRNANRWPGAHLRQRGYKTVGGVSADWNEILIPDWGQAKDGDMAQLDRIETMVKCLVENDNTLGPDGTTHKPIEVVHPDGAREYCAAGNGVKQELDEIRAKAGAPAAATVTMTAADQQAIANLLKPLIPTAGQIADELAKRLGNG